MNQLSKEEASLFEGYIILTYARKVLQKDLLAIEQSHFKFKEPYLQFIHYILTTISKELFEIKKQLHNKKITIFFGENDGTFTEYRCYFRGYEHTSRYLNVHLRNKVEQKINEYFLRTSAQNA